MDRQQIQSELQTLFHYLVRQDYDYMYSQGLFGVSTLNQVKHVIESYPGKMTCPPMYEFKHFEVYGNADSDFIIDFALWFDNAKSDLYAIIINRQNKLENQLLIYDIRVL